jgi:hypothetical protein
MWVTKLAWVEVVVRCDGKLTMVHCKVCNEIKGREIFLVHKFNDL